MTSEWKFCDICRFREVHHFYRGLSIYNLLFQTNSDKLHKLREKRQHAFFKIAIENKKHQSFPLVHCVIRILYVNCCSIQFK